MKKLKIIIAAILFCIALPAVPQFEVTAPDLDAQMVVSNLSLQRLNATSTTQSASIGFMKQAQEKIDKIMESAGWAQSLKSMAKLAFLIENTICTYKNLNFWMNKAGGHSSCIMSFRYQMIMLNIQQAIDLVNLALRDGFRMANEGRLATLNTSSEKFEKANVEASKMQAGLQFDERAKKVESEYRQSAHWKYNN